MQRLGWLLVALLVTHKFMALVQDAHAIPAGPSRLASELKISPQIVRVRLSDLGRVMTIKGTDLALSLAMKPELGNVSADEWVVDCKRSLIIQPTTGKSRVIPRSGVLIESLSGILSVNSKRFRDQIVVYPKQVVSPYNSSVRSNAECLVVNHLNVEKYLESVVNGEFNSQWAEGAVEAQIIAARTYALYQMKEMRKDKGRVFDVESTQKDQVYLGLDRADTKGSKLVAKTRGLIMTPKTSSNLEPIKAFYHASCGGGTVLPQTVWGAKFAGFTKKASCGFCNRAPSFHWEYRTSLDDLNERIRHGLRVDATHRKHWPQRYLNNPNDWSLSAVKSDDASETPPKKGSPSVIAAAQASEEEDHRVQNLTFEFSSISHSGVKLLVNMNAYQARNWFDPVKIKSTLYRLDQKGNTLVFRGRGSGHGVGMCQWGAKHMGEIGYTAESILTHYYPGVKIARLWK